ncbi:MAG: cob(I)yrinic acid a,c-diamide adenosyltransferase [Chloroflexi bacterium]|nr:cob(I)yrinic acid a,c-diamide adenosyltransferase [Chloroflexota bacterium]
MSLFTRNGDQGSTGLLGGSRVSKNDLIMEVLGTLDEVDASLGVARSQCSGAKNCEILLQIQKDLWLLMADIASIDVTENRRRNTIDESHIEWLEQTIVTLSEQFEKPDRLIVPGDVYSAALLDVSRTIVRRAERRFVDLLAVRDFHNPHILPYLNRLSSLCFTLELSELASAQVEK